MDKVLREKPAAQSIEQLEKRKLLADELILICRATDIELGELCELNKE